MKSKIADSSKGTDFRRRFGKRMRSTLSLSNPVSGGEQAFNFLLDVVASAWINKEGIPDKLGEQAIFMAASLAEHVEDQVPSSMDDVLGLLVSVKRREEIDPCIATWQPPSPS